jgi:hypothetical protein
MFGMGMCFFLCLCCLEGRAIAKQLVADFPQRWPGFDPGSGQVGFVVDEVALGQDFSGYFGFSANLKEPISS